MTHDTAGNEKDHLIREEFEKKYNEWELWGVVALISPLIAMIFMILKIPATTFFSNRKTADISW